MGLTIVATVDKRKRNASNKLSQQRRRIGGGSIVVDAPATGLGIGIVRRTRAGNGAGSGIGSGSGIGKVSSHDRHAVRSERRGSLKNLRPDRPEWEIRDTETSAAYFAFRCYRDMSPLERTIAAVAKQLGHSVGALQTLSADFCWPARAAAWDYHIELARLELSEQYQLDMFKRHGDVCCALIEKVKQRLEKMKPAELKPRDVAQWIDVATKIERLSRGVVNESSVANLTQINVQVENMAKLSDDDLEKIIQNEKKRKLRIGAIDVSVAGNSEGGSGKGDVQ